MIKLKFVLHFLFLISTMNVWGDTAPIIGVLEEKSTYDRSPIVRALFKKSGELWSVLDSKENYSKADLPRTLKWHLIFDGRNLGKITSSEMSKEGYKGFFARDNYLTILNAEGIPKLGNKEKRFWKWNGLPENRPIAVNTAPYYKDLEKWKRERDKNFHYSLKIKVFLKLKALIGNASHCNGPPNWDWSEIEIKFDDIDVFKVYKNSLNQLIFSAGLAVKHRTECDGPLDSSSMPIWFYLDTNLRVIGYELDLVEVADFDNDGSVEFLFSHSGYNEDGYSLYESDFSQRYDYYWHYH